MQKGEIVMLLGWGVFCVIPICRLAFAQCSSSSLCWRIIIRLRFLPLIVSLIAIPGFLMSGMIGLLGNAFLALAIFGPYLLLTVSLGPDEISETTEQFRKD
jgi:hypothetical protein